MGSGDMEFRNAKPPGPFASGTSQHDARGSRFRRRYFHLSRVEVTNPETQALHHRLLHCPPCREPLRVTIGFGALVWCPATIKKRPSTFGYKSAQPRDRYDINPNTHDTVATFGQRRGFNRMCKPCHWRYRYRVDDHSNAPIDSTRTRGVGL